MADRGFKITEDLMMHMATLCIPPSCASSMQLLPRDVRETSNIANVRIYVEQAIGRLKVFLLLKNELPISLLPLADDIAVFCVICFHHSVILCLQICYRKCKIHFRDWVGFLLGFFYGYFSPDDMRQKLKKKN